MRASSKIPLSRVLIACAVSSPLYAQDVLYFLALVRELLAAEATCFCDDDVRVHFLDR
jgi:hypothetical protein